MQRLEVSGTVRPIYGSLCVKRLRNSKENCRIQKRLTVQNLSHKLFQTVGQYGLHTRSLTNFRCLLH